MLDLVFIHKGLQIFGNCFFSVELCDKTYSGLYTFPISFFILFSLTMFFSLFLLYNEFTLKFSTDLWFFIIWGLFGFKNFEGTKGIEGFSGVKGLFSKKEELDWDPKTVLFSFIFLLFNIFTVGLNFFIVFW